MAGLLKNVASKLGRITRVAPAPARPGGPIPAQVARRRQVNALQRRELSYAPEPDGQADPGEIVWTWVPYEEDPDLGKDRPAVVLGHAVGDPRLLVALMLSSKDHDGDARWHRIGAGSWDGGHRPSWVRVDRPLAVLPRAVRREGAALDPEQFLAVVEHAAAQRPRTVAAPSTRSDPDASRAGGPVRGLVSAVRRFVRRGH